MIVLCCPCITYNLQSRAPGHECDPEPLIANYKPLLFFYENLFQNRLLLNVHFLSKWKRSGFYMWLNENSWASVSVVTQK